MRSEFLEMSAGGWKQPFRALLFAFIFLHTVCATSAPAVPVPVDINTADAHTMAQTLKQIGPKKAQAIVQYRQQHGPFATLDELLLVKGIGRHILEQNRSLIVVRPPVKPSAEIWWSPSE